MSRSLVRFLGFAFASADLLIELDSKGLVTYSAGSTGRISAGMADGLVGRPWHQLVAAEDLDFVAAVFDGLAPGERRGPLPLAISSDTPEPPRTAAFCACRLPQAPDAIFWTLSFREGARPPGRTSGALLNGADFTGLAASVWSAAKVSGTPPELALVDVDGLANALETQPEAADRALAALGGALRGQSIDGTAAARLGPERFALLADTQASPSTIVEAVTRALGKSFSSPEGLSVQANTLAFTPADVTPEQTLRTLHYVISKFIANGIENDSPGTTGAAFQQMFNETMTRANAFQSLIEDRRFQLTFQPVVSLRDRSLHHHELLVRFSTDQSPFGMIRLAEELGLIEKFDMALVDAAIHYLAKPGNADLIVAANISGRSLLNETFIGHLAQKLSRQAGLSDHLMFEITESSALSDLALANRNIQALRKLGFGVCLDDFGAGAASLPYLQALTVDAVKIDGQYVRDLATSSRDAEMIRHIVGMCRSLHLETVAEMVERRAVEAKLQELGVDYGQGWLYGKPNRMPQRTIPSAKAPPSKAPGGTAWIWDTSR